MRWLYGVTLGLALGSGAVLVGAEEAPKPAAGTPAAGAVPSAEGIRFFESRIRPLLVQQCVACHNEKSPKGGLRLDTAAGLRKGGDSGPVVVDGAPEQSLLLKVLHYDGPVKMPPQAKLKPGQIEDVAAWIRLGAPWPGPAGRGAAPAEKDDPAGPQARAHWSFQPVRKPAVPKVKNAAWARSPIDAFVLSKLEAKGLKPAIGAPKRELIRRAYFDLIGLPPSPAEVDAFLADASPEAFEKVVDRLLAMPQFGERWGRHWLDVARYAQTNGYERDDEKPFAWRYRDYVIRSFNDDKPYDQFVKEQIAGDELPQVTDETVTATAFYRLGVWDDEPDDAKQAEFDNLDDVLATMGQAFMGLTVGCARCHDHKFDPISAREYYGLLAFIRNVRRYTKPDDKEADQAIFAALKAGGKTLAVHEVGPQPLKTEVLIRGNAATPGPEVGPLFPAVLCDSEQEAKPELPAQSPNGRTTGRRRVLAEWLASAEHPLTARVAANRVWQHLFGKGIVATPNDFGRTGTAPTHPELLDHLATELVRGGWRLKPLIRQVMLSSTYRQRSRVTNPRGVAVDPGNTLLWRQNMRRLEAEAIRDSILWTSGKLNLQMGGRGIFPALPPEVLSTQSAPGRGWDQSNEEERTRRSVYIFLKRTLGVPILEAFDVATTDSSIASRATTTIAPQALILLNSAFMDEQAAAFAERLRREAGADAARQIELGFRLATSRRPTVREAQIAREYLERQRTACAADTSPAEAEQKALTAFCKVLLNLNEFVYVD
ncbi:MAG: PSD1 and planctomycete cytochrome C domain-containing protein [Armatimonadota bacterium]